jgi:hypothetical protein
VGAVQSYALSQQPKAKLLFGLDANTYARPDDDQQGVTDFAQFYVSKKLNSCYGPNPDPNNFTTFNARTHLQPQLNKVRMSTSTSIFIYLYTCMIGCGVRGEGLEGR